MCATEQQPNDHPNDYHDYVFKEGRLIGDFDNMYRYSEEIPWHQDTTWQLWSAQVGMLMVKDRAPYDYILEIGCGLGYVSALLWPSARRGVHGVDVSGEAIRKARQLHPDMLFCVGDVTSPHFEIRRQYDLVVIRDLFWYVFHEMETVIAHIRSAVARGGYLYVCQSFPALDKPFVGKEVPPHPRLCYTPSPTIPPCTVRRSGTIPVSRMVRSFTSLAADKASQRHKHMKLQPKSWRGPSAKCSLGWKKLRT